MQNGDHHPEKNQKDPRFLQILQTARRNNSKLQQKEHQRPLKTMHKKRLHRHKLFRTGDPPDQQSTQQQHDTATCKHLMKRLFQRPATTLRQKRNHQRHHNPRNLQERHQRGQKSLRLQPERLHIRDGRDKRNHRHRAVMRRNPRRIAHIEPPQIPQHQKRRNRCQNPQKQSARHRPHNLIERSFAQLHPALQTNRQQQIDRNRFVERGRQLEITLYQPANNPQCECHHNGRREIA